MKRSQINAAIREATAFFEANGWSLPPAPRWDVTDFGLGNFDKYGLVLVNLAEEPEYCEKLMYAKKGQITLAHTHKKKKEDIICRKGLLAIRLWLGHPGEDNDNPFMVKVNGEMREVKQGETVRLRSGERITLVPGIYHEFWPENAPCVIGEVSTANDDLHDNFFVNEQVGRFAEIDDDEPAVVKLVSD